MRHQTLYDHVIQLITLYVVIIHTCMSSIRFHVPQVSHHESLLDPPLEHIIPTEKIVPQKAHTFGSIE